LCAFGFKVCKKCYYNPPKTCFKNNFGMCIKNADLMLISNSLINNKKFLQIKLLVKACKYRGYVLFHLSCKNFFCVIFLLFFHRIQIRHEILNFWYPYKIIFKQYNTFVSYKHFLQAFQANAHKMAQKIENIFQKCVFNFACITGFRLIILSKKVQIFAAY